MTSMTAAVTAGLGLAAGTFAIRMAGPVLATRLHLSGRVQTLVDASAIVILCSVMASSALMNGRHFSHRPHPLPRPVPSGHPRRRRDHRRPPVPRVLNPSEPAHACRPNGGRSARR